MPPQQVHPHHHQQQQPLSHLPPPPGDNLMAPLPGGSGAPGSTNSPLARQNSDTLYVIQNPSEEGEERYNMAMGVKIAEGGSQDPPEGETNDQ